MAEEEQEDEHVEGGEQGTDTGEWKPPSKDDWDKAQRRLKKLELDSKRNAAKAKEAEERANKKPETSPEEVERAAEAKAREKVKPRLVRAEARAKFAEAGLKEDRFARAFAMLNLDDLDVDDSDDVHGLEDAIAELKADIPELFTRKRNGVQVDAADRSGDGNGKPKTSAEKMAALFGGR